MAEKPSEETAKSSGRHDSAKSSLTSDVRNLWTTATLSQCKLNLQLAAACEGSDVEGSSSDSHTGQWYTQKTSQDDSDNAWEELQSASTLEGHLGEDEDSRTKIEVSSSMSSPIILKHRPHRAYWVEQQNRLPLPLVELMESEVLEILTKALQTYRSGIGKDHSLTKQLQRHVEGLKRRRSKRQHVLVQ